MFIFSIVFFIEVENVIDWFLSGSEVGGNIYSLYVFFWVLPRRLIVLCRRFGTLYLFHLHRLDMKYLHIQPMKMEQIVFRNVGIQQSDAGEIPKRIHTRFKTRRKFEIKNIYSL